MDAIDPSFQQLESTYYPYAYLQSTTGRSSIRLPPAVDFNVPTASTYRGPSHILPVHPQDYPLETPLRPRCSSSSLCVDPRPFLSVCSRCIPRGSPLARCSSSLRRAARRASRRVHASTPISALAGSAKGVETRASRTSGCSAELACSRDSSRSRARHWRAKGEISSTHGINFLLLCYRNPPAPPHTHTHTPDSPNCNQTSCNRGEDP